jgi:hypothetical protein
MCMMMRHAVLLGLAALTFTGCGRQVAEAPSGDVDLLATGPDREALSAPADYVASVLEASGGLSTWMQNRKLQGKGVVKLYRPDGSFYLTEHALVVYPWSSAIRISADEPRGKLVWQVANERCDVLEGDAKQDISPLAGSYQSYSSAILQIVTAPVRLLDPDMELYREPTPVRMHGQWYQRLTAQLGARQAVTTDQDGEDMTFVDPYWTDAVYFLNRELGLVDMLWLGNSAQQEFLLVRGFDYSETEEGELRVPSKVEIFRADADETAGERLAQLDVRAAPEKAPLPAL